MPVMLAVSEDMEAVELFTGGVVDRSMTSNPPVALVVLGFCRLVTTAIARFGSTASAIGEPLNAIVVAAGTFVVTAVGSSTVRSIEDNVFDPLLATSASARS